MKFVRPYSILIVVFFALVVPFQNCSENLPDRRELSEKSSLPIVNVDLPPIVSGLPTYEHVVSASPASVFIGGAVSVNIGLLSYKDVPSTLIRVSISDSLGEELLTQYFPNQFLSANQQQTYIANFTMPPASGAGLYYVNLYVINADYTQLLYSASYATSFDVVVSN